MMNLKAFKALVESHDLTYNYSDDPGDWRRGENSLNEIRKAAKDLDPIEVKQIWDAQVDKKIIPGFRDPFYWKLI